MSVTDDPITHGIKGYRQGCKCKTCLAQGRKAQREASARFRERQRQRRVDEIAEQRRKKYARSRSTESRDSVQPSRTVGEMERAVIEECAAITNTRPTLVVAAKKLGRSVDDLTDNPKVIALYNSTMKQLMATMAELRGDETDKRKTGKRKSGGRLATVGNLTTKVKRAQ